MNPSISWLPVVTAWPRLMIVIPERGIGSIQTLVVREKFA